MNTTEDQLNELRSGILVCRETLNGLDNFERHMRRGIIAVIKQFDVLIGNIDSTTEALQKARLSSEM